MCTSDLDGVGSGLGLTQCPTCGKVIDGSCSSCPPAPSGELRTREEALRHHEARREQMRRERAMYDRGRR